MWLDGRLRDRHKAFMHSGYSSTYARPLALSHVVSKETLENLMLVRFSFQAKWLAEIAGPLLQWLMHKTNISCIISIDTPIISTKRF
jgi:hypothetical protein